MGFQPAPADEVLIILILFFVYPADVGKRGHEAVLSSGADEHASILTVRIKLGGRSNKGLILVRKQRDVLEKCTFNLQVCEVRKLAIIGKIRAKGGVEKERL